MAVVLVVVAVTAMTNDQLLMEMMLTSILNVSIYCGPIITSVRYRVLVNMKNCARRSYLVILVRRCVLVTTTTLLLLLLLLCVD